jgi:hypothetical protein
MNLKNSDLQQYQTLQGFFVPTKLDLKPEVAKSIGKLFTFKAVWTISEDEGGPYVGQWAMQIVDPDKDLSFAWVPFEDVRQKHDFYILESVVATYSPINAADVEFPQLLGQSLRFTAKQKVPNNLGSKNDGLWLFDLHTPKASLLDIRGIPESDLILLERIGPTPTQEL